MVVVRNNGSITVTYEAETFRKKMDERHKVDDMEKVYTEYVWGDQYV